MRVANGSDEMGKVDILKSQLAPELTMQSDHRSDFGESLHVTNGSDDIGKVDILKSQLDPEITI